MKGKRRILRAQFIISVSCFCSVGLWWWFREAPIAVSPYISSPTRHHFQHQRAEHSENHFAYLWKDASYKAPPEPNVAYLELSDILPPTSLPQITHQVPPLSFHVPNQSDSLRNSEHQLKEHVNRIITQDTGRYVHLSLNDFSLKQSAAVLNRTDFNMTLQREYTRLNWKYYFEVGNDRKVDERFALTSFPALNVTTPDSFKFLNHDVVRIRKSLHDALKVWSQFAREKHIFWWISHGTLLGWFWNSRMLPWDTDTDLQISLTDLLRLVTFNQTLLNGRFLLDLNPNLVVRSAQVQGIIDARVVDTHTGYFLDITSVSQAVAGDAKVYCKTPRGHRIEDISPLHETYYEGIRVWRPHAAVRMLWEEYGEGALLNRMYRPSVVSRMYRYDDWKGEWVVDGNRN
ncbi:LicD family-domain-containing protein [Chytriomyces sp. MP71]|nr:LicD family-domain-containing protein [Chytriomyces sp. MP71]